MVSNQNRMLAIIQNRRQNMRLENFRCFFNYQNWTTKTIQKRSHFRCASSSCTNYLKLTGIQKNVLEQRDNVFNATTESNNLKDEKWYQSLPKDNFIQRIAFLFNIDHMSFVAFYKAIQIFAHNTFQYINPVHIQCPSTLSVQSL